jgi:iron complex outermembrane receptor protein
MKKLLFTIYLLLTFIFSNAQTGTLIGKITDAISGDPLVAATIKAGDNGIIANFDGTFELKLVPGSYDLEISYVGYSHYKISINIAANEVYTLEVGMEEATTILETATVTASKFEQKLGEATISLEVLKPEMINNSNTIAVDEALDKVPGVQIFDQSISIRGGSGYSFGAGSRVLLLIDDIPALQADAGLPNWNDVAIENINQVEVVKGAASALYGSSALNGIVNIRYGYATSEPETMASMMFKVFGSPKDKIKKWWDDTRYAASASLLHKQKFNKFDLVAGGFYYRLRSYNMDTEENRGRITLNTRYRLSDRLSFGFNSTFNKANNSSFFFWANPSSGALTPAGNTVSVTDNRRIIIDPFLTYFDKKGNKHRFQSRYYGIVNDNSLDQSNVSDLFYSEYQFQRKFAKQKLVMTTGLVGIYTSSNSEVFSDTTITSRNFAAYLQLDKKMGERLNLSAGVRYENYALISPEFIAGDTIPNGGKVVESKPILRLGANYRMGQVTYLRASWGQGYRYPTIAEKFIETTFGSSRIIPNTKLKSETGWSAELGVKQGFRFFGWEGYLDIASFWNRYDDMMEFSFVGSATNAGFQSRNVGDTSIKGFEVTVAGKSSVFSIPITILGGYTYIDPKFRNFNEEQAASSSVDFNILKYRTKHNFKIDLEGSYSGFNLGLAFQRTSHMIAIDNVFESFSGIGIYRDANNNGYYLMDARLSYKKDWWKISFLIDNLFNEEYTTRPGLIEPPRNMSLRFDVKV